MADNLNNNSFVPSSALITGASRGVGKALALCLASSGNFRKIIITCKNNSDMLQDTAREISKINPAITVIPSTGDVSDYSYVENLRNTAGSVELIVNNAAISYVGLLLDMSPEEWQNSVRTNISSVFNTCRVFVPDMIHAHSGRILNVSSVWGLAGASCEVAYSATKGAVNSFTRAFAKELAPSGISCNAIALGIIDTDMNSNLSDSEKQCVCDEIPTGRMATPDEAAAAIMNLIQMPDYFTGEVVRFDGGWL